MKAILLLSGGFDSPVAARMLQDQGVALEALHGSFEPVTDDASVKKAETLARQLGLKRLWVAKIGEQLGKIPHDREAHRYYFLLQKRLLYRLADALGDQVGADVIATGENLGQVSSQTLPNLVTLEQAARRPVLRPLLGLDKVDILRLAREWGTYDTSVGPELCDLLGPDKPATTSRIEPVVEAEKRVGLDVGLPAISCVALD
ncbi:MAG: tRNA uracil 4-sulfurtransferase [Thermoplasmata archaeon]|jgi:thiamine biosynthesis protein ThiI|nr:tRNA uracil 4-sulfurtransferase [Thermoplasmata archaeon]MEA3166392.1 tRNA uracil 4-sulfurtransferase [Thermoplasmata archaeon]